MTLTALTVDSPIGPFTAVVDDDGAVVAAGFSTDVHDFLLDDPDTVVIADPSVAAGHKVHAALAAYFAGDVHALDAVDVRQEGPPFRQRAWEELRRIPPGEPITYGELAHRLGKPGAARAAGTACATNKVALIVPCHRVIPAGGIKRIPTGGYYWEPSRKRWLLDHESAEPTLLTTE